MADLLSDGNIRVSWLPACANVAAPTTTELGAGTALESAITSDGLDISVDTADVDTSALATTDDTAGVGRKKYKVSLTLKRGTTRTWESTLTYGAAGFLAVRRDVTASTVWTSGQRLEVYPVQCGQWSPAYGPNTVQRRTIPLFVTGTANMDATVA